MKIKITNHEIREYMDIESPEFPKYVTQILNLSNQNAQGTRPKIVGQMSELIQQCTGKTLLEWEEWYVSKHPEAIENATDKVYEMVKNIKDAINRIDSEMVKRWVRDLVVVKTFLGLRFQEAILKKAAEIKGVSWRSAEPEDESKGIDGFIGDIPVSIKPATYQTKKGLVEDIKVRILYYEKEKDGIEVDFTEILK